ncbi:hypothetical protein [Nostocoides vanveenii]|jgi:hypothetical protein|uniref:Uncharacterized protein n=1 Tax=Nostocoides vanveenii TaxID=330835 RepID=A0ABP4X676_9MICO
MAVHMFAGAVEVHFGEVTGRLVILLFFGVALIGVSWAVRVQLVAKERRRLLRMAALPDAGADEALLMRRLGQRQGGRVIGIAVVYLVLGALLAWSGEGLPWLALCIPFGAALGTGIGQLQPIGAVGRARVAQLRRRELADYVLPLERRLLAAALLCPAVAVILLVAALRAGSPRRSSAWIGFALIGCVALAASVIHAALGRVLDGAVEMSSAAGLAWEEIVRAQTLRDLVGSGGMLAAAGSAAVVWWASAQPGWPAWLGTAAYVLAVAAFLVLGVLWVLALRDDNHFRWARAHALAGVTT